MARWIFVRHGESVANATGTFAGHLDSPLTPQGRNQALALREELSRWSTLRVLSSDLARASETARLALPEATVRTLPGLRERSLGEWEGQLRADIRDQGHFPTLLSWSGRPPRGESQRDLAHRVLRTLSDEDTGEDTLLVAHGGLMRVVLGLLDRRPRDEIGFFGIPNASIHERPVTPGTFGRLLEQLPD